MVNGSDASRALIRLHLYLHLHLYLYLYLYLHLHLYLYLCTYAQVSWFCSSDYGGDASPAGRLSLPKLDYSQTSTNRTAALTLMDLRAAKPRSGILGSFTFLKTRLDIPGKLCGALMGR